MIRDCGGLSGRKKENAAVSHSAASGVWCGGAVLQKSAVFGLRDIPAVEDWNTFCRWRAGTAVSDRNESRTEEMEERSSKKNKDERKNHKKKVRVVVLVCFYLGVFFCRGVMSQNLRIRHSGSFEYQRSGLISKSVWLNHEYAGNKRWITTFESGAH